MASWFNLLTDRPANGEKVWCRVSTFYTTPVLMEWNEGRASFFTLDGVLELPWYYVVRWRSQ